MKYRYLPLLRWKRGEQVGMSHVAAAARADVYPLFIMGADRFVGSAATKKRPAVPPATKIAADLLNTWGKAPCYIDASAIPTPVSGIHPLTMIDAASRAAGLQLIPATRLNAPGPYQAAVDGMMSSDHRGVLLRVDVQEFATASRWGPTWAATRAFAVTDLVLDLQDNVTTVAGFGAILDNAFRALHAGTSWRSVTVAGTSMPENFEGLTAGPRKIPRLEWKLWNHLSGLGLPYRLDYGDYATVGTSAPPAGIKWGYPINVRYTLNAEFLICRGVKTTGPGAVDMDQQLVGHAKTIVATSGRGAIPTCWADLTIDGIATGSLPPQGLEHWVQLGVDRHVELTRSILP